MSSGHFREEAGSQMAEARLEQASDPFQELKRKVAETVHEYQPKADSSPTDDSSPASTPTTGEKSDV